MTAPGNPGDSRRPVERRAKDGTAAKRPRDAAMTEVRRRPVAPAGARPKATRKPDPRDGGAPKPLLKTSRIDQAREERLVRAARALRAAERPLRVLRLVAWQPEVAERFFAKKARELPRVRYPKRDLGPSLEHLKEARELLKGKGAGGPAERWLRRQGRSIERTATMLSVVGTAEFYRHSRTLYGSPTRTLLDGRTTSLDLAKRLDRILSRFEGTDLGPAPVPLTAEEVAERIRRDTAGLLGKRAPQVVVVDRLSARATAGARRIRLRRSAPFTEADCRQLLMHEAFIHVITALNGRRQRKLPILAASHAGTTRTQEGLAVFSELISGSMGPARFRRLAHRILAIRMSEEGADFLDVYRYLVAHTGNEHESFEDARRVFRGGLLTGGAPFTKDGVYLDGLVRVHNFLRAMVELHRADVLPVLFCGRLDLDDIPLLEQLRRRRLLIEPKFLPPWVVDRRFLVSYLAYSGFLNRVRLGEVRAHYEKLLGAMR